ncbi:hypothetical protein MMC07_009906 [Pseudocyphellaria aurata]|nr:hypothetical protein [Pseudocyphellaria aurata]
MWLDRFSGNNTPSGSPPPSQNRSYSPAPRRSGHLAPGTSVRPSQNSRSSSSQLGVKSNASTTSLNSAKVTHGSTLKQQITPPADVADPLKVLAAVVGKSLPPEGLNNGGAHGDVEFQKPSHLVEDIEFNGLSLKEFALVDRSDEAEDGLNSVTTVQTVEEYEKEKDKFEDLHRSILACDNVLRSVEISLTSFQKDLGAVSAEIETLQARSAALTTRLENRKTVERLLRPVIEDICIAPVVVKTISEGPIDSEWVKALDELEKRSEAIETRINGSETIHAISDVKPLLTDLTSKAVERIRDYFVSQIKSLRSPNINAQIIQQKTFLSYKDLYTFLAKHHSQLADEIAQAYTNTMRWYYLSNFTRYRQALEKISLYTVDKQVALGADQTSHKNNVLPAVKASQISHDALSVGRRMDILRRSNQSALTSYLVEEDKQTHHIEVPFFHFNLALIDNASFEYSFLTTFFPPSASSTLSRKFATIFAPTFTLGHGFTKSFIDISNDCLGILLCVRLNQHFAFELQRRKIPAADPYINGTTMLLWPRFQLVMDMHADSVRRATAALPSPSTSRALALATSATSNNSSSGQQSSAPHMLTQRFGHFLQGILALSAEASDDSEPVGRSLERLRGEVEGFLTKAARAVAAARRERFLANNYSLLLTILGDTPGRLAGEMRAYFEGIRQGVTDG